MKTVSVCAECMKTIPFLALQPSEAEYYDDGIAYVDCALGHKTAMILQATKAEILLTSAAQALAMGFTFEAVASASTALERLYEFALKVHFHAKELWGDAFNEFFKEMSNQSERQLGAFMLLHRLEFGSAYKADKNMVRFRNEVVHKGKIPTVIEAEKYCAYVYDAFLNIAKLLTANYRAERIPLTLSLEMRERQMKLPAGMSFSSGGHIGIFAITSTANSATFEEAFDRFKQNQRAWADGKSGYEDFFRAVLGGLSAEGNDG